MAAESFHFDEGLKFTAIDLAVDVCRRQPRGFISHAHADHMAPHELALCTPETARLYQHRHGPRAVRELPFGEPLEWGPLRLTTHPAGHVLGAAMLLVESDEARTLYTGDFCLHACRTAALAAPPPAEVLIMECTFGDPRYRLPRRDEVVERLLEWIDDALRGGETPVIQAYTLGKSQEITRTLNDHDYRVMQHPLIWKVSQVYESLGCDLGPIEVFDADRCRDYVVLAPPRGQKSSWLDLPAKKRTAAVTGWALDRGAKYRLGVDLALPLSDHADFDELIECVERVGPRRIYCTHGPDAFADRLRDLGFDARILGRRDHQTRLF